MNQGLIIVIPLIFFFLIDFTLFVNSIRQGMRSKKAKLFSRLAACVMLLQGLIAIKYSYECNLFSSNEIFQSFVNLISILCMIAAAYIFLQYFKRKKQESYTNIFYIICICILPVIIGVVINRLVFLGGYAQIGCSYGIFLLYLEEYITEVNENQYLKSKEILNERLQDMNMNLMEQIDIVSGLSNAYFSAYAVDLETGRCKPIKVIEFFRRAVENCHIASVVTKAFLILCVMPEDREKMQKFTNWHTLVNRLENTDLTVEEFHGMISPWEWCRASWIVSSRDENGKAKKVLFTVEDITENVKERMQQEKDKEQARKELEESRKAAEIANKAKTDFLFNMSHDIRTPMNAIIGYADLMDKHFDEKQRCKDYLKKIRNSSNFLLSLVNNVLEMARIESGKLILDEKVCEITQLAEEITSVYSELMERKGITFTMDIDVKTKYYYGDRLKISEIFLNILSNAYKYTLAGGSISLKARELNYQIPGYILLQTTISDTGVGMSKEFLPRIFEEFSREYTSTENRIEGTGLGMPIVKKLVDFMNGSIEVHSELGKGSTFIINIPHKIAKAEDMEETQDLEIDLKKFVGKRILLVEDNELNTEIATEILMELGFIVEHAEDGLVCMDKILNAKAGYYDLILMDVQMPNLDGYGATKKIRALSDPIKANIPIIAMTANAFEEDRKNALAIGMNEHLAKPIETKKLIQTLAHIL